MAHEEANRRETDEANRREMMDRREAIRRVSVLLGGAALVGGDALLAGCGRERPVAVPYGSFSVENIEFLDEVAETILPETSTPGAKAANTGAFMALMVTDSYDEADREIFRAGMRTIDEISRSTNNVSFIDASPEQRLAILEIIDREQKTHSDARSEESRRKSLAYLSDQRQEAAPDADVGAATEISTDPPAHYFRMMKELALLGYFTSEIGCTQAQRYLEAPGRFDPCIPYQSGEKTWAPHA
jgi:hypothetical protein